MEDNSCSESNISSLENLHIEVTKSSLSSEKTGLTKIKIFEVFHKKEIIFPTQKGKKSSSRVEYKCIYCSKIYPTLHRIKSHLKFHVNLISLISLFIFYLYRQEKRQINVIFVEKVFLKKET